MKNIIFFITIFSFLASPAVTLALDKAKFDGLIANINAEEYDPVEKFLADKKKSLAKDPEYYVVLLNYVVAKGENSGMVIAQGEAEPGDLQLTDPKTGEAIGFMGSRTDYNEKLIVDGLRRSQKALKKHFNTRLDIHFGIVSIAERVNRWDIVGEQIVEMLETSRKIDNKWIWGPINSMEGDPKEFMIQNILPRTHAMFRADTPETDKELQKVSTAMIRLYPKEIYGYANLGVYHLVNKEYDKAEKYFKQALEIDPKDEIVIGNLERLEQLRKEK